MSLFERSVRVPLIIAAPGAKARGQTARGLVELLDLYPTLAGACGLKLPAYLDGASLQPMLDDPAKSGKTAAFSQLRRGQNNDCYSVRTDRFRYTEWTGGAGSATLFDLEADPRETKNLAADPAQAATVAELKKLLATAATRGTPAPPADAPGPRAGGKAGNNPTGNQ